MKLIDHIILFTAIVVVIGLYTIHWTRPYTEATNIEVHNANGLQYRLSLQHDQIISIAGRLGESQIEIKDGKARFISSPCQHKRCIQRGWLSRSHDFMACLPNEVMLNITGTTSLDSVVF